MERYIVVQRNLVVRYSHREVQPRCQVQSHGDVQSCQEEYCGEVALTGDSLFVFRHQVVLDDILNYQQYDKHVQNKPHLLSTLVSFDYECLTPYYISYILKCSPRQKAHTVTTLYFNFCLSFAAALVVFQLVNPTAFLST